MYFLALFSAVALSNPLFINVTVSGAVVFLVIIAITIVAIVMWRKKQRKKRKSLQGKKIPPNKKYGSYFSQPLLSTTNAYHKCNIILSLIMPTTFSDSFH